MLYIYLPHSPPHLLASSLSVYLSLECKYCDLPPSFVCLFVGLFYQFGRVVIWTAQPHMTDGRTSYLSGWWSTLTRPEYSYSRLDSTTPPWVRIAENLGNKSTLIIDCCIIYLGHTPAGLIFITHHVSCLGGGGGREERRCRFPPVCVTN